MTVYVFSFKSMWLGGRAVVLAETEDEAVKLLRLDNTQTNLTLVETYPVTQPGVVYFDDGDY